MLDTRSLYGHSGQKPKAAREAARTGRGPSPARCGRSPGSLHQTYKTPTSQAPPAGTLPGCPGSGKGVRRRAR